VWHGVIFVQDGPYKNGIFRFEIVFPTSFPEDDCPVSNICHLCISCEEGFKKNVFLSHLSCLLTLLNIEELKELGGDAITLGSHFFFIAIFFSPESSIFG